MKRILCIRLPDWPIQRLTLTRPELKGRAIVLHETRRGTERVVACSARAMALGVAVGMPLAEVVALRGEGREPRDEGELADDKELQIENCELKIANSTHHSPLVTHHSSHVPHPVTPSPRHPVTPSAFPYDPLADRQALEALAEWSARFSPVVGLEDSTAPESLLLDVTGLAHLFDGEASLAERIVHDFARRGLSARVAVADTIGAAWAVAHFHSSFIIHHSSFIILPPGGILPAIRPLPVAALRIPEETVGLLRQLGIDRIGHLEALPRGELSSRFGPELLRRWDQAIGRLPEPVSARDQPPKLQAEWAPEHPVTRRESIEAALEQLIAQVAGMLARLGRGAIRLECRLDCTSGESARTEPVRVSVGLFRPTASAGHLSSLARMQLERLRLPGPLLGLHVVATATAPLVEDQQELFFHGHASPRRHARYLAELVERLSSRLGRRSVLRARLVSDAQPELAWRYDSVVDGSRGGTGVSRVAQTARLSGRRSRKRPLSAAPETSCAFGTPTTSCQGRPRRQAPTELPPRPLRLLRRPVAISVTSIMPDGPPVRFHYCGRSHRIANSWGPERIETGWWRNRTVGRDYYQVETTTGGRLWLFRRLRDGRWFLHGMFE